MYMTWDAIITKAGGKCRGKCTAEVMVYIETMDQPTVLYVIYCMVSAQQANLSECEVWKTSATTPFFCSSLSRLYWTDAEYLTSLWLHNHHTICIYVMYIVHMASVQQMNLSACDGWKVPRWRHCFCLSFYGCTITVQYACIEYDDCTTIGT